MFWGRALSFCGGRASLLWLTTSSWDLPNSCCSKFAKHIQPQCSFLPNPFKKNRPVLLKRLPFSCTTTRTGALEVTTAPFAVAQQRGRLCHVPNDYRSYDHTAAACHRPFRSTGTTGPPNWSWSKAFLESAVRFHWIWQESRGTLMEGQQAFCYTSLCGPGWALRQHHSEDACGRGQRLEAVHSAGSLCKVTMRSHQSNQLVRQNHPSSHHRYAHNIHVGIWGEKWFTHPVGGADGLIVNAVAFLRQQRGVPVAVVGLVVAHGERLWRVDACGGELSAEVVLGV